MPLNCESDCLNCHKPTPESYTYHYLDRLIVWLTHVTHIPWFHSHQDAGQPKQMFGVVEITGVERSVKNSTIKKLKNDTEMCRVSRRYFEIDMTLKVKNKAKEIYNTQEYVKTPLDVMMDIQMAYEDVDLSNALKPVSIKEFFDADTLVKDDDSCCWYDQAQMNISLCMVREFSRTEKILKDICFALCDGKIECPEPKPECD